MHYCCSQNNDSLCLFMSVTCKWYSVDTAEACEDPKSNKISLYKGSEKHVLCIRN